MVRKKKQIKLKEPVRLREKKLKDGNRSLYLDIYSNGIRKYEYLKLYLVPELNESAKEANKQNKSSQSASWLSRVVAFRIGTTSRSHPCLWSYGLRRSMRTLPMSSAHRARTGASRLARCLPTISTPSISPI